MKNSMIALKINKYLLFAAMLMVIIAASCSSKKEPEKTDAAAAVTYYCPMHPQVTSEKPGVCPICHMDLVLQTSDALLADGSVNLSKRGAQLARLQTIEVQSAPLQKEIRAYSTLEIPENSNKIISARFTGRIEQLFAAQTGQQISKGAPLFVAYSTDIFRMASEYLQAKDNYALNKSDDAKRMMEAAKKRLELSGAGQDYFTRIEQKNEPDYFFTYHSPYSGIILQKSVVEGAYVNEGSTLYEAADLSTLWSVAEVFEYDAPLLKKGQPVQMVFTSLPGKQVTGSISFISPVVTASGRTVQVRVELKNADGQLKPKMYGESVFNVQMGNGVLIPEEAIVFTGRRNVVWVQRDSSTYEPRNVRIGIKFGNKYQVLSGLAEGDIIAAQGNYLIDSESRLKSGDAVETEPQHAEHAAETSALPIRIDKHNPVYKKQGIFNAHCPVLGDEVESDGPLLLYKGKVIGFCCKGCDKKFIAEPEKYFSYISPDGKKYTGPGL